jgi:hypothetical protein
MPHPAYGWNHQKIRAQLLAELRAAGSAFCPICWMVMTPDMDLQLHHSNPLSKQMGLPGDALAHAKCNLSYGNGSRHRRRGKGGPSRRW